MRDLYIGIDLGTTGIKVGLFDAHGAEVAFSSRAVAVERPAPGFAEFDAEGYAELAFEAVGEVLSSPGAECEAVRAIGFSSQAQTFVLLGSDDRPVHPSVSWLDVRAGAEADELSAIAGRRIDAIASCPKILWLRRHKPEVLEATRRVLLTPDHLIYLLTGRAVSDPVTAGSSGAYGVWEKSWSDPVLKACGLSEEMMPGVILPGQPAGTLTASAARRLGLSEKVLVAVGTNDQSVGAVGAGNVSPGCASLAMGTALAIIATSSVREGYPPGIGVSPHPAAGDSGGLYAILAFAKTSGVVLAWFRETLTPDLDYEVLFREIEGVPIGCQGLTCLPHFSGTATPDFDAAARGCFSGLTLAHGRAHLARALVESLSFTVSMNFGLISSAQKVDGIRAIGGGARADVWLQMIADSSGLPVERPGVREAACLGAAELGMVAAGRYASVAAASEGIYRAEKRFEPDRSRREHVPDGQGS